MRCEFSRFVESDLEAIADYIAQDNPVRAVSFIREIRQMIQSISRRPFLHQLRPEIGKDARLAVVGRHVILYRVLGRVVRVERVVYGGRDLPTLFQ